LIVNQLTAIYFEDLRVSMVIYLPRKQLRFACLPIEEMQKRKVRALRGELF